MLLFVEPVKKFMNMSIKVRLKLFDRKISVYFIKDIRFSTQLHAIYVEEIIQKVQIDFCPQNVLET